MVQFKVLEQNHPRVDGLDKVTGRATYAADVYLPEMAWCKLATSTCSHAKIASIDVSRARELPGVYAVITGSDFPDIHFGSGALKDRYVMARDEVYYVGEPVAAVAAVDEMTAQEAVDLIQVEYEDLPVVVDVLDALREGSSTVHPDLPDFEGFGFALGGENVCTLLDADRGDVDAAFHRLTSSSRTPSAARASTRASSNRWPASPTSRPTAVSPSGLPPRAPTRFAPSSPPCWICPFPTFA